MFLSFIVNLCVLTTVLGWTGCADPANRLGTPATPPDLGREKSVLALNERRAVHTATLLADGRVLIAGGMDGGERALDSTEIFDPKTGKFTAAAKLTRPRVGHTAVLLNDGKVLFVGGYTDRRPSATAEIYDPKTDRFGPVEAVMKIARGGHSATVLADGKVLIAGSENGEKNAEIFDPATLKFTETGSLNVARFAHTATLLKTGEVLLAGGSEKTVTKTAELFNPKTGAFRLTGELSTARYKHSAVLLDDGNVLVAGGSDNRDWTGQFASAEIYQTAAASFKPTGEMNVKRFKIATALVKLPDGRVFVAGGDEALEIYDPKTGKFQLTGGKTGGPRFYTTVTLVNEKEVLIVEGYDRSIKPSGRAYLFSIDQTVREPAK